jgi:predicted kinase
LITVLARLGQPKQIAERAVFCYALNMSKLILISGPSGSGKSYLAKYLSEQLLVPYFSKDNFKELLFDTVGWSDKEWSRKLGAVAIQTLYLVLDQELRSGRVVIAEANFKPEFDTEQIEKFISLYNTDVLELHCTADTEILRERAKKRVASQERHPGHLDAALFEKYFDPTLHNPVNVGELVKIDTNDFAKVNYSEIVNKVNSFIS